jgi:hypothetical protein
LEKIRGPQDYVLDIGDCVIAFSRGRDGYDWDIERERIHFVESE